MREGLSKYDGNEITDITEANGKLYVYEAVQTDVISAPYLL